MKDKKLGTLILAVMMMLSGWTQAPARAENTVDTVDVSALFKSKDVEENWETDSTRVIDLNAFESGSVVSITEKGDYVLSGSLEGQILIEAPEDEKVRLILNGVTITCPQGPAIYEKQADKLIITLAEDSENALTDGEVILDGDDTIGAAIYAEDDLSINGAGSLSATGTQAHGIQSKADLIIANGNITVQAEKDGIRGRNSVLVLDGEINITAGGDGIVSTRADAEDKGWVVLAGGTVSVKTGDGAGSVRVSANSRNGGGRGRMNDWSSGFASADDSISKKAVKAATTLTVVGGSYTFDCADDGLHGVNVNVHGGDFTIRSGDDGMHADEDMTVNGGRIDISQCYEGLEGKNVTVNGGSIRIIASDDGINASGGSDGSGLGNWGRRGGTVQAENGGVLTITDGEIAVTAGGDGLDSNGSILISGGVIGVWAATTRGEGAIDFNGTGTISGGTLLVASTGGVMQDTAGLSGQSVMAFSGTGLAGETVTLSTSDGLVLGSYTPEEAFDTLLVSSSQLQEGDKCTITCGNRTLFSGEMSGSIASVGSENMGFGRNKNRRGW